MKGASKNRRGQNRRRRAAAGKAVMKRRGFFEAPEGQRKISGRIKQATLALCQGVKL
jgi:hypothetical protein